VLGRTGHYEGLTKGSDANRVDFESRILPLCNGNPTKAREADGHLKIGVVG